MGQENTERSSTLSGVRLVRITDNASGAELELDQLVNSIPTTGTFHHLGHEGKLFIHSSRHDGLANGADFDHLIRLPAGNANRQIHMRFNVIANAVTGSLDVDGFLYKDATVSADGTPEVIVSTNDAIIRTTGVTMFSAPTITDIGTFKARTWNVGEKKGAGNVDQAVPEWILAPDGENERNYIFRITNNSGGNIDFVLSLFFYESESTLVS